MDMLDLNVTMFSFAVDGRTPPTLLRRVREWIWAWRHRDEFVRYSISGMIRIRVKDAYLLVRNRHFGKYQPAGGVFKRLSHSARRLSDLGILEDNMFAHDDLNRADLRIQVPARSIGRFADWYATRVGRECEPWREFHEELVAAGILPADVFPFVQLQYVRQHNTGIERARHTNNGARFECRIAEIFELEATPPQQEALLRLYADHGDHIMWATAEQIHTKGVVAKKQAEAVIAETAEWIL
jgi:hypothetical protein